MPPIHQIGHSIDLEGKGGEFLQVNILPGSHNGTKVVSSRALAAIFSDSSSVAILPDSATCANCTHPNFEPKNCPRRPDEDHIVIGGTAGTMLEIFARRAKQVCPMHSAGE